MSAGLKNRRSEKKENDTSKSAPGKRANASQLRYTHAHRATQSHHRAWKRPNVVSKPRDGTLSPNICDSIVKSPGFFPTFFRRENPRARARSSPPPANATAALYPSRDLRTRTKTNDDERRRVKQKRYYSQVRRHPRVTLLL